MICAVTTLYNGLTSIELLASADFNSLDKEPKRVRRSNFEHRQEGTKPEHGT